MSRWFSGMADQPDVAPEQYFIQTLVAIKQADGWRCAAFPNTLMQPDEHSS